MFNILKRVRILEEFDEKLFKELNIGVELQDFTEPTLTKTDMRRIIDGYKIKLKDIDGKKSMHGPFIDLKPGSPDSLIREASQKRYIDALKAAKELELDYIVFHSQLVPQANHPAIREFNIRQAKEAWINILDKSQYDGIIVVENVYEQTPDMLVEYIKGIDMDNIKINLDIGHAKIGNASLEKWIYDLKDYIAYMHIHTNDGIIDTHNPIEKKEIEELYRLLDKYDLKPAICLEYTSDDLEKEISKFR